MLERQTQLGVDDLHEDTDAVSQVEEEKEQDDGNSDGPDQGRLIINSEVRFDGIAFKVKAQAIDFFGESLAASEFSSDRTQLNQFIKDAHSNFAESDNGQVSI